jgi:hypothetical protein
MLDGKSIFFCQRCRRTKRARGGAFVVCRCGEPMTEKMMFITKGQEIPNDPEENEDMLADQG